MFGHICTYGLIKVNFHLDFGIVQGKIIFFGKIFVVSCTYCRIYPFCFKYYLKTFCLSFVVIVVYIGVYIAQSYFKSVKIHGKMLIVLKTLIFACSPIARGFFARLIYHNRP